MPIAHSEGNYADSQEAIERLEAARGVVFRYVDEEGELTDVNGSMGSIAGICNEAGNVLGMMPHPERCAEEVLGGVGGLALFASAVENTRVGARVSA